MIDEKGSIKNMFDADKTSKNLTTRNMMLNSPTFSNGECGEEELSVEYDNKISPRIQQLKYIKSQKIEQEKPKEFLAKS